MLGKQLLDIIPHSRLRFFCYFISLYKLFIKLIRKFQNFILTFLDIVSDVSRSHFEIFVAVCLSFEFLSLLLFLHLRKLIQDFFPHLLKQLLHFFKVNFCVDLVRDRLKVLKVRFLLQLKAHLLR